MDKFLLKKRKLDDDEGSERDKIVSPSTDVATCSKTDVPGISSLKIGTGKLRQYLESYLAFGLLQFSTSWLCEQGFSALVNVKTKKRQRLTETAVEDNMRICLSNLSPRITSLCNNHQGQISH